MMSQPPPSCFILLGFQRSGTTVLQRLLSCRSDVVFFENEIWASTFFGQFLSCWTANGSQNYSLGPAIVEAMIPQCMPGSWRALKCNVHGLASTEDALRGLDIGFPWLNVIALVRSDLLAQAASLRRAQLGGRWHASDVVRDSAGESLSLPLGHRGEAWLINLLLGQRRLVRCAQEKGWLLIDYERDLLADGPEVALKRIEQHIGLPPASYPLDQFPKVAPPAEQYVANYKDARVLIERLKAQNDDALMNRLLQLQKPRLRDRIFGRFFAA